MKTLAYSLFGVGYAGMVVMAFCEHALGGFIMLTIGGVIIGTMAE